MVAQITAGTAFDKHGRPFRRRNPTPALIALVVMVLATTVIWTVALTRHTDAEEVAICNPPPPGTTADQPALGEQVTPSTMVEIIPADLTATTVRVLNASGRGGQATEVAGALRDLGFPTPTAANDPIYATERLDCQGQIRFGEAGEAAAAAVWLVAPCTELFRDNREDDSVDLALGTDFAALTHSDDVEAVLARLRPDAADAPEKPQLIQAHSGVC
ncbi:envelope integrity protein Cei [Mycolicibacillus parakoreensis]|uniref:Envelope integrity protein Cei n=1 Tax=Mycolicibacillus parakoreensis TaxID=1069221 RepID=A0ABY3U1X9_9MYCO|nr:envelope integrity protein Cei [Mycolicibacillus parakoreensis]MCV7317221.1 envelope integrity protein Cei [Mycolicibacillus parakoreensis]ULN51567.1 envelope integrity protein Cei [Mycolicibacillus parakoreensis]HLR99696.1 envelope integrity protein Cei [Mycolicibacillus parakoreensis]